MKSQTLETGLLVCLEQYKTLPPMEREKRRDYAAFLASSGGTVKQSDRRFNVALLAAMEQHERTLQTAPPLPTQEETRAALKYFAGCIAVIGGGLVAIVGGLYLVGAMVVGIGDAVRMWAFENRAAIGCGLGGLALFGILVAAWNNRPKSEVENESETTSQNQTVIVNVFTSQNGNVDVKN